MSRAPRAVVCPDEEATRREGATLAGALPPGALVSLEGDLGAGKTVFVRVLAEGLGIDAAAVSSPTFVLAVEHRGARPLLHCDLYRLPEGAGIDDLGVEEALADGFTVAVEWGERMPEWLRRTAWRVLLAPAPLAGPEARALTIIPPAE